MIEQHDKCSLHEIENLITSLKGIFEGKKNKQTIQNQKKKKEKRNKEKDTEIGEF